MTCQIPYINEEVANRDFKYYIFDWDDNILHMPTRIKMEHRDSVDDPWKPVEVSTATFALVRGDEEHYRAPGGVWADAFRNFEDAPGRDNFIEDTIAALEKIEHGEKPSPSFYTFKKTLTEGRIFAIVTARGHAPETIERAVRVFIKYVLTEEEREIMMSNLRGYRQWIDGVGDGEFGTDAEELDYYLGMCRYSAVTFQGFKERMEEREKMGTMVFDNAIALPHAIQHAGDRIVLAIGVFPKPIRHRDSDIRVIFLLGIPDNIDGNDNVLVRVYDEIITISQDSELLDRIASSTSYKDLQRALYRQAD